MAIKAAAEVTITDEADLDSLVTWYQLAQSTTAPSAPTTTRTADAVADWQLAEPSFDPAQGTFYLYTVQQTRWKDGSCEWGAVQLSSSYEQAKQAWNRANAAFVYADNSIDESESRLYEAMPTSLSQLDNDMEFLQDGYIPDIDETFTVWGKLGVEQINVNAIRAELLAAAALLIGERNAVHIETDGTGLAFLNGSERVAYIDSASGVFYMTRSVVLDDMYFGDGKWKWYKRTNNNMSVKWMG